MSESKIIDRLFAVSRKRGNGSIRYEVWESDGVENIMRTVIVTTGTVEDFFERSREIARGIDRGEALQPEYTLTFEDPADMFAVMSPSRLELFRAAKKGPSSITALAQILKRDRSAVKKDIDQLVAAGLLDVTEVPLPGHGRQKFVRAIADSIQLQAVVA